MCGFIAILQERSKFDLSCARRALLTIAHRGPDASGEWHEGNVFLGHRRLSIIDLTTGGQPMESSDGTLVVVFNGEIYNFLELRAELASRGAVFRTQSDTEVILEGYRSWGSDIVRHLSGMFSFVIWDRRNLSAFAARDRLGIKPLSWAICEGALIIASTMEPFAALGQFNSIDLIAVRDLMAFDYIPSPRSILRGVHKLEPGTCFKWRFGLAEPIIDRYWMPPFPASNASAPDEFALENLLEDAVKRQMISDVPIGVFLSGGIDSSLIVAMMARQSSSPLRTFSVAFNEVDLDESAIARLVAERFGTDHTVLHAEEIGTESLLELLGALDEPFCDPTFIPTYALSKMTKHYVKVALSGDGGDEIFGGYPKYLLRENGHSHLSVWPWVHHLLQEIPWRPRGLSHLYWRTLSQEDQIRFAWTRYGNFPVFRKDMRQLLSNSYHKAAEIDEYFEPWEQRARRYGDGFDTEVIMRTDLETYLSENCLVKTDRASMLASLEVRVPFLDELILDRILPLTTEQKIPGGQLKALLAPIVRRVLPRQVWDRPKHGFTVPLHTLLAGPWRSAIETILDWGESNVDLFNYSYLRRLHAINTSEGGIDRELWNPFVFLAWARAHSNCL